MLINHSYIAGAHRAVSWARGWAVATRELATRATHPAPAELRAAALSTDNATAGKALGSCHLRPRSGAEPGRVLSHLGPCGAATSIVMQKSACLLDAWSRRHPEPRAATTDGRESRDNAHGSCAHMCRFVLWPFAGTCAVRPSARARATHDDSRRRHPHVDFTSSVRGCARLELGMPPLLLSALGPAPRRLSTSISAVYATRAMIVVIIALHAITTIHKSAIRGSHVCRILCDAPELVLMRARLTHVQTPRPGTPTGCMYIGRGDACTCLTHVRAPRPGTPAAVKKSIRCICSLM